MNAVKGMNDILPQAAAAWQYLEGVVREIVQSYGYDEIRLPLLEHTELFQALDRGSTDIVEKEMYTFADRGGESLSCGRRRPPGWCAPASATGSHNQRHKLWTSGPMFRRERPQRGRYRQFHQFDVEAFGYEGPDVDAEMILMSARIWKRLGIDRIRLEINSLGTAETRARYRERWSGTFRT